MYKKAYYIYKSKYISDYAKCVLWAKTFTLPTQDNG